MDRASKLSQNDTGGEVHGNQQLVQEPKSPSHNCCPLAKAHQQRLFRYSRSLPRPLLEYQKLASHHPRCFAELDICFFESSPPRAFQGGHKILYVGYQARVFSLHMKGENI